MSTLALVAPLVIGCGSEDAPSDNADDDDTQEEATDGGKPDANKKPDTGTSNTKPDGSGATSHPKLDALAGRYLMRLDTLGTANTKGGVALSIRSRVSTLQVAELKVEDDHLVARERVCTQSIEQKCLKGCSAVATDVDPRVIEDFLLKKDQQRTYTLDADGTFTGEKITTLLGYDGDPDPLPEKTDDSRVWDVVPGGEREGLLSNLRITVLLAAECDVYGVQKFVSTFSGKLGGSDGAPTIPEMVLELDGSGGSRIGASQSVCESQGVDSPVEQANIRMVRFGDDLSEDEFWNCPQANVFDDEMAPTPLDRKP